MDASRELPPPEGTSGVGLDVDRLLSSVDRAYASANMRLLPVQPRARMTVERILAAARRVALSQGSENFSLQAVAAVANVRLGAIYRYFSTPDDIIRMVVRLWVAGQFDRYRKRLATTHFTSHVDVVEHLASHIEQLLVPDFMEPGVPQRLKYRLLRDYHELPLGEHWAIVGDIHAATARSGLATGGADGHARLAMALAATGGLGKMMMLHAPGHRGRDHVRRLMREILWTGVNPDPAGDVGHHQWPSLDAAAAAARALPG